MNTMKKLCRHGVTAAARLLPFTKSVAVVTIAAFVMTSVVGPAAYAVNAPLPGVAQVIKASLDGFNLPYSVGQITDAKYLGSKKVVIAIQDLHCHPEVQRNIARIMGILDGKFGTPSAFKVFVEGGIGAVDTSWVNKITDPKVRADAVETLMNAGRLTGAEYYSIQTKKYTLLEGLEDEKPYFENLARLNEIIGARGAIAERMADYEAALAGVKQLYYSAGNQRLDKITARHESRQMETGKYYTLLLKLAARENMGRHSFPALSNFLAVMDQQRRLPYQRINRELTKFIGTLKEKLPSAVYDQLMEKASRPHGIEEVYVTLAKVAPGMDLSKYPALAKFFRFVEMNQQLNPLDLVKEHRQLIGELRSRLSRSRAEREVAFIADFLRFVRAYYENKMSADDYAYFTENAGAFYDIWSRYANADLLPSMARYKDLFAQYYGTNIDRNRIFMNKIGAAASTKPASSAPATVEENIFLMNTQLSLPDAGTEVEVLVTGGFHTQGLSQLLEEKGISYVVITPNVTTSAEFAQRMYDLFARELSGQAVVQEKISRAIATRAANPSIDSYALLLHTQANPNLTGSELVAYAREKGLQAAVAELAAQGLNAANIVEALQREKKQELIVSLSENGSAVVFTAPDGLFKLSVDVADKEDAVNLKAALPRNIQKAERWKRDVLKSLDENLVSQVGFEDLHGQIKEEVRRAIEQIAENMAYGATDPGRAQLHLSQGDTVTPVVQGNARVGTLALAGNPIHWGQIVTALEAVAQQKLDKLVWILQGPGDTDKPELNGSLKEREEMARAMLALFGGIFEVSTVSYATEGRGEKTVFDLSEWNAGAAQSAGSSLTWVYVVGSDHKHYFVPKVIQQHSDDKKFFQQSMEDIVAADAEDEKNGKGEGIRFNRDLDTIGKIHYSLTKYRMEMRKRHQTIEVFFNERPGYESKQITEGNPEYSAVTAARESYVFDSYYGQAFEASSTAIREWLMGKSSPEGAILLPKTISDLIRSKEYAHYRALLIITQFRKENKNNPAIAGADPAVLIARQIELEKLKLPTSVENLLMEIDELPGHTTSGADRTPGFESPSTGASPALTLRWTKKYVANPLDRWLRSIGVSYFRRERIVDVAVAVVEFIPSLSGPLFSMMHYDEVVQHEYEKEMRLSELKSIDRKSDIVVVTKAERNWLMFGGISLLTVSFAVRVLFGFLFGGQLTPLCIAAIFIANVTLHITLNRIARGLGVPELTLGAKSTDGESAAGNYFTADEIETINRKLNTYGYDYFDVRESASHAMISPESLVTTEMRLVARKVFVDWGFETIHEKARVLVLDSKLVNAFKSREMGAETFDELVEFLGKATSLELFKTTFTSPYDPLSDGFTAYVILKSKTGVPPLYDQWKAKLYNLKFGRGYDAVPENLNDVLQTNAALREYLRFYSSEVLPKQEPAYFHPEPALFISIGRLMGVRDLVDRERVYSSTTILDQLEIFDVLERIAQQGGDAPSAASPLALGVQVGVGHALSMSVATLSPAHVVQELAEMFVVGANNVTEEYLDRTGMARNDIEATLRAAGFADIQIWQTPGIVPFGNDDLFLAMTTGFFDGKQTLLVNAALLDHLLFQNKSPDEILKIIVAGALHENLEQSAMSDKGTAIYRAFSDYLNGIQGSTVTRTPLTFHNFLEYVANLPAGRFAGNTYGMTQAQALEQKELLGVVRAVADQVKAHIQKTRPVTTLQEAMEQLYQIGVEEGYTTVDELRDYFESHAEEYPENDNLRNRIRSALMGFRPGTGLAVLGEQLNNGGWDIGGIGRKLLLQATLTRMKNDRIYRDVVSQKDIREFERLLHKNYDSMHRSERRLFNKWMRRAVRYEGPAIRKALTDDTEARAFNLQHNPDENSQEFQDRAKAFKSMRNKARTARYAAVTAAAAVSAAPLVYGVVRACAEVNPFGIILWSLAGALSALVVAAAAWGMPQALTEIFINHIHLTYNRSSAPKSRLMVAGEKGSVAIRESQAAMLASLLPTIIQHVLGSQVTLSAADYDTIADAIVTEAAVVRDGKHKQLRGWLQSAPLVKSLSVKEQYALEHAFRIFFYNGTFTIHYMGSLPNRTIGNSPLFKLKTDADGHVLTMYQGVKPMTFTFDLNALLDETHSERVRARLAFEDGRAVAAHAETSGVLAHAARAVPAAVSPVSEVRKAAVDFVSQPIDHFPGLQRGVYAMASASYADADIGAAVKLANETGAQVVLFTAVDDDAENQFARLAGLENIWYSRVDTSAGSVTIVAVPRMASDDDAVVMNRVLEASLRFRSNRVLAGYANAKLNEDTYQDNVHGLRFAVLEVRAHPSDPAVLARFAQDTTQQPVIVAARDIATAGTALSYDGVVDSPIQNADGLAQLNEWAVYKNANFTAPAPMVAAISAHIHSVEDIERVVTASIECKQEGSAAAPDTILFQITPAAGKDQGVVVALKKARQTLQMAGVWMGVYVEVTENTAQDTAWIDTLVSLRHAGAAMVYLNNKSASEAQIMAIHKRLRDQNPDVIVRLSGNVPRELSSSAVATDANALTDRGAVLATHGNIVTLSQSGRAGNASLIILDEQLYGEVLSPDIGSVTHISPISLLKGVIEAIKNERNNDPVYQRDRGRRDALRGTIDPTSLSYGTAVAEVVDSLTAVAGLEEKAQKLRGAWMPYIKYPGPSNARLLLDTIAELRIGLTADDASVERMSYLVGFIEGVLEAQFASETTAVELTEPLRAMYANVRLQQFMAGVTHQPGNPFLAAQVKDTIKPVNEAVLNQASAEVVMGAAWSAAVALQAVARETTDPETEKAALAAIIELLRLYGDRAIKQTVFDETAQVVPGLVRDMLGAA